MIFAISPIRSMGKGGEDIGFDAIDNILIRLSCSVTGVALISPQNRHLCMISHSLSDLTQIPTGSVIPPHSFLLYPHREFAKAVRAVF